MLKGYRTVILAGIGFLFTVLQAQGVVVPQDEQAAIATGIASAVMLFMRLITRTPMGMKE